MKRLPLAFSLAPLCFGALTPILSNNFASTGDNGGWTTVGSPTESADGLVSATNGAFLTTPLGVANYELRVKLKLAQNGGSYVAYSGDGTPVQEHP